MIGLACSTLSCDGFGDNNFIESFHIIPSIGFKYVEFNCWHPADLTPKRIQSMKDRSKQAGIKPASVYGCSFGGNNHHELSKDVCHKIRMIEAACELGCRRIVATGGPRGEHGGLTGIIEVLKEITPIAQEKDVLICLENHANNNLENIEDYEKIFQCIDSPNVGLCVDTGHFDAANVDLGEVVKRFAKRINHIHVKEAVHRGAEQFVLFGAGVTDNNRVIEDILSYGYVGYISVELAIKDKSNLYDKLKVPYDMFKKYESID